MEKEFPNGAKIINIGDGISIISPFLSFKEACAYCGIKPAGFRRLNVPCIGHSKGKKYHVDDLCRAMKESE